MAPHLGTAMPVSKTVSRLALSLSVSLVACGSVAGQPPKCPPPFEEAKAPFVEMGGLDVDIPQLLRSRTIRLDAFSAEACVVECLGAVPLPYAVFASVGQRWELVRYQTQLADNSTQVVAALVATASGAELPDSMTLARDLTTLLVGEEPFGVVLVDIASIPVDRDDSDVRRDALRRLNSEAEVKTLLLAPLGDSLPAPPAIRVVNGGATLEFWTWSYFGGVVERWEVTLTNPARIESHYIGAGIGSWDLLM